MFSCPADRPKTAVNTVLTVPPGNYTIVLVGGAEVFCRLQELPWSTDQHIYQFVHLAPAPRSSHLPDGSVFSEASDTNSIQTTYP